MTSSRDRPAITALPGVPPNRLGESPLWHPAERVLYWCDIPARALHRFDPRDGSHRAWPLDAEPGSLAPVDGSGDLVVALRDGIVRCDPAAGRVVARLADAPYDRAIQRFNDGKAGPDGAFWVGSMHEPRDAPRGALHRWADGRLERVDAAGGATIANGLAWSPDARTMLWADTTAHRIAAFDFDPARGTPSRRRVFAEFAPRAPHAALDGYGGRPDGAAVDAEGFFWFAMYEGARLVRLAPDGRLEREVRLPVRCPTMPCFGDDDLRTLYVTTARDKRPDDELAREPLAGCVLRLRVDVAGRPAHAVRL